MLSPDAIALHRIILGEVTRFPVLGEVFWRAGPERNLTQIEAFLRSAAAFGTLIAYGMPGSPPSNSSAWCAAKSICASCCASNRKPANAEIRTAVKAAVETFLRAFGSR